MFIQKKLFNPFQLNPFELLMVILLQKFNVGIKFISIFF